MTRIVGGRIGDPTRETVGQPVAIVLPDPTTLFARRADRLASLAGGHPMADWLRFMARVTRAQHDAVLALAPVNAVDMIEGIAPLATNGHQRHPDWREGLHLLLRALDDTTLPDQAGEALRQVQAQDPATLESLADGCLHGGLHQGQVGEALYVAAALSVYFARHAAALPAADVHMLAQRGRCPACGSAPVAGVITASGQAPGVRYLHCGLCATAWNHVRAVCTTCGGSRGVALLEIEGGDGAAQAETCNDCHSYAKMLYQAKDMAIEPMADDLASLGLDMLVSEAGYQRASNPLVITAH